MSAGGSGSCVPCWLAIAAAASVIGSPVRGLVAPGIAGDSFSRLVRITDMVAVPIEPPIC